jgi:hypothetical protein
MCERKNTLVCCFDHASPRISAFEIHEWIHSQLQVSEQSVLMVQIDGTRRQVFIKFTDHTYVQDILHATNGTTEYKHLTGEIFPVRLELAGMGHVAFDWRTYPPNFLASPYALPWRPMGKFNQYMRKIGQQVTAMRYPMEYGLLRWRLPNTFHHMLP